MNKKKNKSQKFVTKDEPLSEEERTKLDRIIGRNAKDAFVTASPELKDFLRARQR